MRGIGADLMDGGPRRQFGHSPLRGARRRDQYGRQFKAAGFFCGMSQWSSIEIEVRGSPRPFYFRKGSSDERAIQSVFVDREYDLRQFKRNDELTDYLKRQEATGLRPLVVDAGANIGTTSTYFIGNLPNALVVAIEPDMANFGLLRLNVDGLNVEPVRAALSATTGQARVVDPGEGFWGYRTEPVSASSNESAVVPRITVNDIYAAHREGYFPFAVKIDIEGGEQDVFSDHSEWVARTPIVMVELHDWLLPRRGTSRSFLRCITQHDRDFLYRGETIFSIANDLDALIARQNP
jgi:FkbM family methyltransferase